MYMAYRTLDSRYTLPYISIRVLYRTKLQISNLNELLCCFFCGPKGGLRTNLFVNAQNKKIYLNFLSGKSVKKEISINLQPSRTIMLFFCGPKGGLRTNLFVNAQNKKIYLNFLSGKSVKKEISINI